MEKYISKDALVAEIEKRIKEHHSGYLVCLKDILSFIDTLEVKEVQEEPVSEGLEDTTQTITYEGKVYTRRYKDKLDAFACKYPMSVPKPSKRYAKYSDVDLTIAVKEGAQWKEKNILKPADGEDLPEYDRGVIVLTQHYPLESSEFAVSFAHRPNPKGWDGKSLISGKVEHYTPKTYDKGQWNQPNVKWWLDIDLSKSTRNKKVIIK